MSKNKGTRWSRLGGIAIVGLTTLLLSAGSELASGQEKASGKIVRPDQEKSPPDQKPDPKEEKSKREITRGMLEGLDEAGKNPIVELINDVENNMRQIEDLLNRRNTGDQTQELQSNTLEKIDKLIEEAIKAGAT